ncbi:MAG: hypothetical protein LLG00_11125 [Planctomycetaceae bacterium]|nr:hypothetical protein [Planctomycetaceae bacterium]
MNEGSILLAAFGTFVGFLAAVYLATVLRGWLDPQWAAEIDRKQAEVKRAKAERDAKLFCPHCQKFGHVTTDATTVKKGISGGKATAALLTGGVTMLATGLSQENTMTQATCANCGSTWLF